MKKNHQAFKEPLLYATTCAKDFFKHFIFFTFAAVSWTQKSSSISNEEFEVYSRKIKSVHKSQILYILDEGLYPDFLTINP